MAHQVFEKTIRIHFGDCDPAGIVYHPTYYVLLNKFHEDYLHEVLKVGFIEIRRFGVGCGRAHGFRVAFASGRRRDGAPLDRKARYELR